MKKSYVVTIALLFFGLAAVFSFQNCSGNLKSSVKFSSGGLSFEEQLMSFAPENVLAVPTNLHFNVNESRLKWDLVARDARCTTNMRYDVSCTSPNSNYTTNRWIYNYMTMSPTEVAQSFQCMVRSSCAEIGTPENPGGDLISSWIGPVDVNIPARANQLPQATNINYTQSTRKLTWNYSGPSDSKSKVSCVWDSGTTQGVAPGGCRTDSLGGIITAKIANGSLTSLTLPNPTPYSPDPYYCEAWYDCKLIMYKFDSQGNYFFSEVPVERGLITLQGSGGGGGGGGGSTTTTLSGGGGGGGGGDQSFAVTVTLDQNGKNKSTINKKGHYNYDPSKSFGADLKVSGGEVASCDYSDNRGFTSPCVAPHYYNYPPNTFEDGYHGKFKIISTTGVVKTLEFWLD